MVHPSVSGPPGPRPRQPRETAALLRTLLLALVGVGALGLLVELALLEHWTAAPQWVPLVTLTLILVSTAAVAARPDRATVRLFGAVMILAVAAGLTGIGFHFYDNWAFEREVAPDASGVSMLGPVLTGATPLLAPGSLVQLGLLGLVAIYRHPALSTPPAAAGDPLDPEDDT